MANTYFNRTGIIYLKKEKSPFSSVQISVATNLLDKTHTLCDSISANIVDSLKVWHQHLQLSKHINYLHYLLLLDDDPFLNMPDNLSLRSFLLPLGSVSPDTLMSESDPAAL